MTIGAYWRASAVLVCACALAAASSARAQIVSAPALHKRFGIAPSMSTAGSAISALRFGGGTCIAVNSDCTALTYQGGPVQHGQSDYLFFWTPAGHTVPAQYVSGLQGWLNDVGAADYSAGNLFGVNQQFYDFSGPSGAKRFVPYAVQNAGTIVDTNPYPANGCTDQALPVCLTDGQIQAELSGYIASHNLPTGIDIEYFVFTAQGVGSCFDGSSGSCAYTGYCGYHSYAGTLVYADMPWAYNVSGCDVNLAFGAGYPNADYIDPVVSVFSHELSETMTDPHLDAWWQTAGVDAGYENGDKCSYTYGAGGYGSVSGLSNNGSGYWNYQFGGHQYLMQLEFDNSGPSCAPQDADTQPSTSLIVAPNPPAPGASVSFSANVSDPAGVAYVNWDFGDGATATGTQVNHTYASAGSDTVTAIVTDNHGNEQRVTQKVTVTVIPPAPSVVSAPSVTGSAVEGQTLAATPGTWANGPTAFAYQWERCTGAGCTLIGGAAAHAYVLSASDIGHAIRVLVTASNAGGLGGPAPSASSAIVAPSAAHVRAVLSSLLGRASSRARKLLRSRGYDASFTCPGAGALSVSWYSVRRSLLASGTVTCTGAGPQTVKVHLTAQGQRFRRQSAGRKVTISATFAGVRAWASLTLRG